MNPALALALVALEWLAIGRASGITWPAPAQWPTQWALHLLTGAFLVGLSQLLLALLGVGFANVVTVLLLALLLALLVRRFQTQKTESAPTRSERSEAIGWLILAAVFITATIRSWLVPEAGWDAYSHWGLKAQALATAGTIVDAGTVHEYYPPLVPLLEAWFFEHTGSIDINTAKLIWPLIGGAFAITVVAHLKLIVADKRLAPYLAALIVVGTPQLLEGFWTGQADLALTAYLTLATLAAWQWQRTHERAWLIHVAAFGAAAALTKYEGLPRVGVVVAALVLESASCRALLRPALTLAAASIAAYLPWLAFRQLHGIPSSSEHLGQFQPQAIGIVLSTSAQVLGGIRTGGGILVAILAAVAAGKKALEPPWRLLSIVIAGQVAATILAFLVTETAPDIQVRTSLTRLVEQFLPVALFASAAWLANVRPIIRAGR